MKKVMFAIIASIIASVMIVQAAPRQTGSLKLTPCPMPIVKSSKPLFTSLPNPRRDKAMWSYLEGSLRLRKYDSKGYVSGSAHICYYDEKTGTAYAISCAHVFSSQNNRCFVEMFYKDGEKLDKPIMKEASVLCIDVEQDVSFLKFTPGFPVRYFPIAPKDYVLHPQETLISCGCDGSKETAAYEVTVYGYINMQEGNLVNSYLTTYNNSPRPGRSGGGTISKDGQYVAICVKTSNVDGSGYGYFVPLKRIHECAAKHHLGWLCNINNNPARLISIVDRNSEQGSYPQYYIPIP